MTTEDNLKKEIEELKNKRECFHKRELLKAKLEGYSLAKSETLKKVLEDLRFQGRVEWEEIEYQDDNHTHMESIEVFKIENWKLKELETTE
jgi:hypothetical protein